MVRLALLVPVAGALLAALAWLFFTGWRPSTRAFPVQGIDVSHHQGEIDWFALPGQDVDFAYIKATEGGDHRDRLFARNWEEARQAEIARGAYHGPP